MRTRREFASLEDLRFHFRLIEGTFEDHTVIYVFKPHLTVELFRTFIIKIYVKRQINF